jgi:flagellar basal-body rod modification protein FlgD
MITNQINQGQGVSQSSQARETLSSNYSDFLRLLTTQLQNQDPTAPTDTNQLTQQIATLSQVEQQINTNKNLEQLITMISATQYNSVVSYIGKVIETPGNAGALENGEALFSYYLADEATTLDIKIKDSTGNVVYTGEGTKLQGRNEFVWDGKNNEGEDMPTGTYTIEVKAQDASQNDIVSQTFTSGIVTSIDSVGGVVYLSFGDISVPLTSVVSVRQATQQNNG